MAGLKSFVRYLCRVYTSSEAATDASASTVSRRSDMPNLRPWLSSSCLNLHAIRYPAKAFMTNLLRNCVLTYLQCTHQHTFAALTRLPSFMAGFLLFAAARKLPPWSQGIPTYHADMFTMFCHAMSCSKSITKSMDEKRHAGNKLGAYPALGLKNVKESW